jgi:hypothetical protein
MAELVDDALLVVFSQMEAEDVVMAGAVCRHWHELASEDSLWRHLYFRDSETVPDTLAPGISTWKEQYIRFGIRCLLAHSSTVCSNGAPILCTVTGLCFDTSLSPAISFSENDRVLSSHVSAVAFGTHSVPEKGGKRFFQFHVRESMSGSVFVGTSRCTLCFWLSSDALNPGLTSAKPGTFTSSMQRRTVRSHFRFVLSTHPDMSHFVVFFIQDVFAVCLGDGDIWNGRYKTYARGLYPKEPLTMILDMQSRTVSFVFGEEDFGVAFVLPKLEPGDAWTPVVQITRGDILEAWLIVSLSRSLSHLRRRCLESCGDQPTSGQETGACTSPGLPANSPRHVRPPTTLLHAVRVPDLSSDSRFGGLIGVCGT